jgi:FMN-dependent NADH-azoreductase
MESLLHLDSSARYGASFSRRVSAEFAQAWRTAHPEGRYTYRDLAAHPVPPVDAEHLEATGNAPAGAGRSDAHRRASAVVTGELVAELRAADTVVIGSPMYNYSVPSVLKAWLDRITVPELLADRDTGVGPLSGIRFVVVTARGGAYGPGTPRERFDFQEPYLRAVFGMLGVDAGLSFIHTELTKAHTVPHLAQFRDAATTSFAAAIQTARGAGVGVPAG